MRTGRHRIRSSAVAAKPAKDLALDERRFALQYLFQANPLNVIGRYPRYREFWERFAAWRQSRTCGAIFSAAGFHRPAGACRRSPGSTNSFCEDPDIAALVAEGPRLFARRSEICDRARAGTDWAGCCPHMPRLRRTDELRFRPRPSITRFCRWSATRMSARSRRRACRCRRIVFAIPRTRANNSRRGLDLHEKVFGLRPKGVWPSEGSVSEEVARHRA